MCTNYRPLSVEAFRDGVLADIRETKIPFKAEVFPNEFAPIVRLEHSTLEETKKLALVSARFGLAPFWAQDDEVAKLGRMAYNSRTETVASKPMFRTAWNQRRFCLIPAEAFYEPSISGLLCACSTAALASDQASKPRTRREKRVSADVFRER